jgi:signal transduction histidine kinase
MSISESPSLGGPVDEILNEDLVGRLEVPETLDDAGFIGEEARPSERGKRSVTIRLKLTLWYGFLFLLGGIVLITANYFMVRNSLNIAPEKARAAVEQQFGLPAGTLSFPHIPGLDPGREPQNIGINVNGVIVPVQRLVQEAQNHLRAEALRQLWIRSLMALAIMAVIVFGLSWLLAGRMLRPLHAITSTARRLSGSTLHERINLRGPRDELKDLADTFDNMLGRLDTAFTAQREFVANASHELRTPLTIIRTEVDVTLSDPEVSADELRDMGSAITEAVDRSEGLIDGLLVLASADAEGRPAMTELDLAQLAEEEVDVASSEADGLDLRLDFDLQPAPVMGDRALLERLVGNLVENAIRHNLPNGWFSVKTSVEGDKAVLTVANSGPILAQEDLERLFERFYRPDKSRSRKTGGFGLGLSIVKSVATAHGGDVHLAGIAEGGLEVTVTLPARLPAQPNGNGKKNGDTG